MSRVEAKVSIDIRRTEELSLPGLAVLAGQGNASTFYAVPSGERPACPKCGAHAVKIQSSCKRVLQDRLPSMSKPGTFIELHYHYKMYRCQECNALFVPPFPFAEEKSRTTIRLEEWITEQSLVFSMNRIAQTPGLALSVPAIKKIIARCRERKKQHRLPLYTSKTLCLTNHQLPNLSLILIWNIDMGKPYLVEAIPDSSPITVQEVLRRFNPSSVTAIVTDFWEPLAHASAEVFPSAEHLIDPGFLYNLFRDILYETAVQELHWLPQPKKLEIVMAPPDELPQRHAITLRTILEQRPHLDEIYTASSLLYRILSMNYSLERLMQWRNSLDSSSSLSFLPEVDAALNQYPSMEQALQYGIVPMSISRVTAKIQFALERLPNCASYLYESRLLDTVPPDTIEIQGEKLRLGIPADRLYDQLQFMISEYERSIYQ